MNIFGILKVDDECSFKQYPLDGLRLNPLSVSLNKSGVSTTPLDGVSVLIIPNLIF
jgi:hypothetical protein